MGYTTDFDVKKMIEDNNLHSGYLVTIDYHC